MNTEKLFQKGGNAKIAGVFFVSFAVFVVAVLIASLVQTDFGQISVSNVYYDNYNGKRMRAKLFRPNSANREKSLPGVVFIHGYQNNRESGDAYNIEMAKRGLVVLGIDAIGRGNSDVPNDLNDPNFDDTFGTRTSMKFLRSLPFVKKESVGIMGHSMGAKFAYNVALEDPSIRAVIIIGSAYDKRASFENPRNMLMIIGELDEFREFFTKTKDIKKEWMLTEATQNSFPYSKPEFGKTYGDFSKGTARQVFIHRISHIQESHNKICIAQAVKWMTKALNPPKEFWKDPYNQSWPVKETMTLLAMLACFICILPVSLLLLKTAFFGSIREPVSSKYACTLKSYLKSATINGVFMWLYLPLIMTLFAIHKFVVPVDPVFPMLLVDAIVWWFIWINIFGLFLFSRWYKKEAKPSGITLYDLGISFRPDRFSLDSGKIIKTVLLGLILFGFLYACEVLSEYLFMVDFRFIYPLVSDLTPYRAGMFL